jgi:opacity protein-like surface antigen
MTKKIFLFALILMCNKLSQAQVFPEGSMNVSVGYGFGNFVNSFFKALDVFDNMKTQNRGPIHAKGEYMVNEKFGIGLSMNYFGIKSSTAITFKNASGQTVTGERGVNFNSLSGLVRFNYYYMNTDNMGLYSGAGIGYKTSRWDSFNDDPKGTQSSLPNFVPLGFEAIFGVKGMFTPQIGAYAEFGFAKSFAQVGVVFNFANSSKQKSNRKKK